MRVQDQGARLSEDFSITSLCVIETVTMNVISLTGILSENEVRSLFNANFTNPVKQSGAKLLVEPAKGKGVDFGAVGTAYDYWLRCVLRKNDPDIFKTFLGYRECISKYGDNQRVLRLLKKHTKSLSEFSKETLATNAPIFEACLFIAKFETEYRSGYPVETFDVKPQNIEELGRIAEATKIDLFLDKNTLLNPIFAVKGSKLAIKADGDIVLGEVLLELKTSSQLTLKDNWRQLIGYWVLNSLRGSPINIQRLGVYYPRFNYFIDFSLSDLMTPNQQNNIVGYFQKRLGKNIRAYRNEDRT
jgi:hypothetical protein